MAMKHERVVKSVFWHPNTRGAIIPFINFDEVKDGETRFDSVPMKGYSELAEKKAGVGSKLELTYDTEHNMVDYEVVSISENYNIPTNCTHCSSRLVKANDQVFCVNHMCYANSRAPLFALYTACRLENPKNETVVKMTKWLNSFPVDGTTTEIENMAEFLILLDQEKDKIGSESRKKELEEAIGDGYEEIVAYEKELLKWLKKGPGKECFWYSLNLPLGKKDAMAIANKGPRSKMKGLSKDAKKLMDHHKEYFIKMHKLFYALSKGNAQK